MFNFKRNFEAALQPLLARALSLTAHDRGTWLDELRTDCPAVVRELEHQLTRLNQPAARRRERTPASGIHGDHEPGSLESLGLRG